MKHHSATFAIAEQTGLNPRTVQRHLAKSKGREKGQWNKPGYFDVAAAVAALEIGAVACENQPCRYAPIVQFRLFE